ncbi:hypothetical protein [Alienimonas chondri]|uniref:Secreted protein n=1 Tax=Alienimonas chondri TaxID=2681879 RepID=A0ABX1VHT3_9PLAN|nr:hypothetical protein [Alienimonas chondri]NNJ27688.1 hypothetical protein [Alienimonas chondri]
MLRSRLLTASALLLASCLFVGCDSEPDSEPSVGGVPPANLPESTSTTTGELDPIDDRPSEELDEE